MAAAESGNGRAGGGATEPGTRAGRWRLGCRLVTEAGDEYVVTASLVRRCLAAVDGPPRWGHGLVWSFIDVGRRLHRAQSWVDRGAVSALRAAAAGATGMDARVRAALLEALAGGLPVAPDRLFAEPVRVGAGQDGAGQGGTERVDSERVDSGRGGGGRGEADLVFGEVGAWRAENGGGYRLTLRGEQAGCDLGFAPGPAPGAEGPDDGGGGGPRCAVGGRITVPGGRAAVVVSGEGWYESGTDDGLLAEAPGGGRDIGRRLLTVFLDDGWRVDAGGVEHVEMAARTVTGHRTTLTAHGPDGRAVAARDVRLRPHRPWTSLSTLNRYPTSWEVASDHLRLRLYVTAHFPGQEVRTMLTGHGFLCAAARVSGTRDGRPVTGWAVVTAVPAQRIGDLEEYLGRLQEVTRREVRRLYPDRPSAALTTSLLGGTGASLDGFADTAVHETLVRPVRHLADPGGRGWRAYVCCAAIELLGVRADPYAPLLAAVEVIHSANLAIDDIQDGALHRRGVPAVHRVFGVPATMNAATAAYFALDRVIDEVLPDDDRLRLAVCRTYLRMLRAAHGGQALDLAGHTEEMDAAVASGDARPLLRRLRATHRFKTGVPARAFAELGALAAGAVGARPAAIGAYFEAVGTAYQISDDVLDVLGAAAPHSGGRRKHSGEDLRSGRVTMPLAHCVGRLPADRMSQVWKAVRDGGAPADTVHRAAADIARSGAVQACRQEARTLVDDAWRRLAPLVPDSPAKIMVRSLGRYAALREAEVPAYRADGQDATGRASEEGFGHG
ncbi:polyprenyl synthetase family protein [Streptomyces caniferus]|uniref:polyprenyl synthetase family protein n=1 Tax=Streptomyces caniferus TaxID=285557 RepID=UPI002E2D2DE5|nr:polyprenyl synthetase family protein [Streptomyces caniferus]